MSLMLFQQLPRHLLSHKSLRRAHRKIPVSSKIPKRQYIALGAGVGFVSWYLFGRKPQVEEPHFVVKDEGNKVITLKNDGQERDLREKFNFIDKVVKRCADAVVYIEIQDPRRIDVVTGEPLVISNGSGFIVREDGWLVTNAHVVISKPHSIILAKLNDGTSYKATVEDADMNIDIALLKINCDKKLPCLKLGESSKCSVGEWVIALGSPLSLSHSVTAGVISSTSRNADELGLRNHSMKYIQTDAAITFGNSGGPLVNLDGDVIGINNLRITAGISFAIPIDYAKKFVDRGILAANINSINKPLPPKQLGITTISITQDIVRELLQRYKSLPDNINHGIFIWKVLKGTIAHKSGLKSGDIITHINGMPVTTAKDIYNFLTDDKRLLLKFQLIRRGQPTEVLILNN